MKLHIAEPTLGSQMFAYFVKLGAALGLSALAIKQRPPLSQCYLFLDQLYCVCVLFAGNYSDKLLSGLFESTCVIFWFRHQFCVALIEFSSGLPNLMS